MRLKEIYRPISKELARIEKTIKSSIESSGNGRILAISRYLSRSGGKRLRPALVTLSAKIASGYGASKISRQVVRIASAVELVHMASLIHDDVVDHSSIRHNMPTVNSKWGDEMSIILGGYLYSIGFDLISSCRNPDILACVTQAARMMCEGELIQVCERDNIKLLKERYITIVKNKTANLFAASCQAGVLVVGCHTDVRNSLKEYGLNFGIAFQIIDDSRDLTSDERNLGRVPGADFKMGELTLPLLNLISEHRDKDEIRKLISQKDNPKAFDEIRSAFASSGAFAKTEDDALRYIKKAKDSLRGLRDSSFKQSLFDLADYAFDRIRA